MKKQSRKLSVKDLSCYVLITCSQPNEEGHMQVEMTHQGDTAMAAYLIQEAQLFIHQEKFPQPEIHSLKS